MNMILKEVQEHMRSYRKFCFAFNFGFLGGRAIGGLVTCGRPKAIDTSVPEITADMTLQTSRVVNFSNMPSDAITRWLALLPILSQPVHSGSAVTPNLRQ